MIYVAGKSTKFVKQTICRNCSSELDYTDHDAIKRTHTDYTGCVEVIKEIKCPNCGSDIKVR